MATQTIKKFGLWAGLILFLVLLVLPAPAGLPNIGWRVAAVTVLIGFWWFTEAVPVTLTGSLPFLVLPLLGVAKPDAVAGVYMSPVLFLILGGSLIGLSFEKWNLHRRVALMVVSRVNPAPRSLLLALMSVTAFVSMWVNNSATTVMMLPIALAALAAVVPNHDNETALSRDHRNFAAALILSISLASNLGGFATPIGTPVNSIAIGILERSYGVSIGFAEWMAYGVPFMVLGVPICWWILSRVTLPFTFEGATRNSIREAIGEPGSMHAPERRVLAIVLVVALSWIFLPLLDDLIPNLTDAGIAVAGALALCLCPSGDRRTGGSPVLLEWEDAKRAPWYLILLLGGGLALADAVVKSGLSAWIGQSLVAVSGLPWLPMLLAITVLCALITEAASNVATATIFMPIAATLALGANYDPAIAALAAAMAANLGFANPAATSSNALVYSTGRVPIAAMLKTGLWIDAVGAVLIALACAYIVPLLPLR
ncbi:MAG: SLC13 family permease [Gammaproteobacteria bacterium]